MHDISPVFKKLLKCDEVIESGWSDTAQCTNMFWQGWCLWLGCSDPQHPWRTRGMVGSKPTTMGERIVEVDAEIKAEPDTEAIAPGCRCWTIRKSRGEEGPEVRQEEDSCNWRHCLRMVDRFSLMDNCTSELHLRLRGEVESEKTRKMREKTRDKDAERVGE